MIPATASFFTGITMLSLVSLLGLITTFIVSGYTLECAKSVSTKKKSFVLPEWKNLKDLFIKGLHVFVITIVYLFIAAVIFLLGFRKALKTNPDISQMTPTVFQTMGAYAIIGLVLGLVLIYFLYMALTRFAIHGQMKSAFELKEVFKKAWNTKYLATWVVMMVFYVIATWILGYIPYVGTAIASFLIGVTAFTAFGETYSEL